MKICENCGMEYGDDNSFCPFCDERYGVVILADDVISAEGLPPYKEEFPVIGETGAKQENFAANRDKIYKRNIRLAERENFLPKMEVREAYKPVVPLAEIGKDGAISPYKPPNPIVVKFNGIRKKIKTIKLGKTGKTVLCVLSVAAVFLLIIGVSWFETTDIYINYQNKKNQKLYEKRAAAYSEAAEEVFDANTDYSYIYGKDGAVMKLALLNDSERTYSFTFENKTGETLYDFTELFAGAKGMGKFNKMSVSYPSGARGYIPILDGVPDIESEELLLPVLEPLYSERDTKYYHTIEPDGKVSGYLSVNIPEKITVTGEDSLKLKLSYVEKSDVEGVYIYAFEFTNTTDEALLAFWDKFIREEYTDKFVKLSVLYPNGNPCLVLWENGLPHYISYRGVDEHGRTTNVPPYVGPNATVSGNVYIDFGDKD